MLQAATFPVCKKGQNHETAAILPTSSFEVCRAVVPTNIRHELFNLNSEPFWKTFQVKIIMAFLAFGANSSLERCQVTADQDRKVVIRLRPTEVVRGGGGGGREAGWVDLCRVRMEPSSPSLGRHDPRNPSVRAASILVVQTLLLPDHACRFELPEPLDKFSNRLTGPN